jgi:hypothetical protein
MRPCLFGDFCDFIEIEIVEFIERKIDPAITQDALGVFAPQAKGSELLFEFLVFPLAPIAFPLLLVSGDPLHSSRKGCP